MVLLGLKQSSLICWSLGVADQRWFHLFEMDEITFIRICDTFCFCELYETVLFTYWKLRCIGYSSCKGKKHLVENNQLNVVLLV